MTAAGSICRRFFILHTIVPPVVEQEEQANSLVCPVLYCPVPATMEHSSPLAAMQPPSVLFGHCFRAEPSYSSCAPRSALGPSPFNFKDLSMKKGHGDYLNMKPVRGSSPTASLAADLSQNFHIDQRYVKPFVFICFIFYLLSSLFSWTV